MSLLSICNSLTLRVFAAKTSTAASSGDPKTQQAVEFINEAGQELAARYAWQVLTNETVFTTLAAESQGSMASITGAGFSFIVNETLWNRSQMRPVFGPKWNAEWQMLKAQLTAGPWVQYRLRQNLLLFNPIPVAGQTIAFEWCSSLWGSDQGGAPKSAFTADTDVAFLDERLITLDALWRFKRANKLSYDEDFEKAESAIEDAMARDGSKPTLDLSGGNTLSMRPGTIVPSGNWTL